MKIVVAISWPRPLLHLKWHRIMLLLTFKTFKLIEKDGSKKIAILRAKLDQLRDLHVVNRIKANFLKNIYI